MTALIIGIIFFLIIFIGSTIESIRYNTEQKKREEEWALKEKRNVKLSQQIAQYSQIKERFKTLLDIDLTLFDYREWIYDKNGDSSESFIGYMYREKGDNAFNINKDVLIEKCKNLNSKELFSITPREKGVNFEELKKYYKKVYWDDRKKDFEYD
jgi:hypothetical protein